jgi:hypothetical protein
MNPTTRRYPRSLVEAFGPNTSRDFAPDEKLCYFRALGAWLLRLARGMR